MISSIMTWECWKMLWIVTIGSPIWRDLASAMIHSSIRRLFLLMNQRHTTYCMISRTNTSLVRSSWWKSMTISTTEITWGLHCMSTIGVFLCNGLQKDSHRVTWSSSGSSIYTRWRDSPNSTPIVNSQDSRLGWWNLADISAMIFCCLHWPNKKQQFSLTWSMLDLWTHCSERWAMDLLRRWYGCVAPKDRICRRKWSSNSTTATWITSCLTKKQPCANSLWRETASSHKKIVNLAMASKHWTISQWANSSPTTIGLNKNQY